MGRLFVAIILFGITGCADNMPVIGPYPQQGTASWYTPGITSTGAQFANNGLTCAMRKINYGKYYKIVNVESNKSVIVRHNDFGPSKYFYNQGRIIDLSKDAFAQIADIKKGIIQVIIEEIETQGI